MDAYARVDREHDRQLTIEDESFEFKDYLYDQIDKAVTLTTDLDYPNNLIEYRDKLQEIFDDIVDTVNSVHSSKCASKFTNDLLTVLGDILNPRKAV